MDTLQLKQQMVLLLQNLDNYDPEEIKKICKSFKDELEEAIKTI